MRIEAMEALSLGEPSAVYAPQQKVTNPSNFSEWVSKQVLEADDVTKGAEQAVRDLALGRADNLHNVMLELEHARLSVELVVQVRNRLLEAYQEVMRMQV